MPSSALSLALYWTPSSQMGAEEADKEGAPCESYRLCHTVMAQTSR